MERYRAWLTRRAYALCGHADDARDLAQETLIDAWLARERHDPARMATAGWLLMLLRRNGSNLRARRAVQARGWERLTREWRPSTGWEREAVSDLWVDRMAQRAEAQWVGGGALVGLLAAGYGRHEACERLGLPLSTYGKRMATLRRGLG